MIKSNIIKLMEDAVIKAGRCLVRDFGEVENLQVSKKGTKDFVTSADHRSEEILISELRKSRPKYGFLVEESGEIKGDDEEHRWIADPLDGTINFMHGIPHFVISLALEKKQHNGKREIIAGVVYAPASGEIYWAEKGIGAFCGNRRLSVSNRSKGAELLVAVSLKHMRQGGEIIKDEISPHARIFGAAALELAYVAAGKIDAFWHSGLKSWDMAAGVLLIREARGIVTAVNGGSFVLDEGNILASNGVCHEKICSTITKYCVNK